MKKKLEMREKKLKLKWMKKYNQRPEVKERIKEYNQRPEVKKRKREYYHLPGENKIVGFAR